MMESQKQSQRVDENAGVSRQQLISDQGKKLPNR